VGEVCPGAGRTGYTVDRATGFTVSAVRAVPVPSQAAWSNPEVSGPFRVPLQVTESARLNLSRWRHGFEPRWDYEHKGPGQGTSRKAFGGLNRDSTPNISRISRVASSVARSGRVRASRVDALELQPAGTPPLRRSRQNKRSPDRDLMVIRGHDQAVLYDVDLHVVSALFRLREGADRGGRRVVLVRSDRRVRGAGQRGPNR
jgi:hypothetical protein